MNEMGPASVTGFISAQDVMSSFVVPLPENETIHTFSMEAHAAALSEQTAALGERMRAVAAAATEPLISYVVYDKNLTLESIGLKPEAPGTSPAASLDFLKYMFAKPVFEGNHEEYQGFLAMQTEQRRIIDRAATERAEMEAKEPKPTTPKRKTAGGIIGSLVTSFFKPQTA